jgi:hypothetical protein
VAIIFSIISIVFLVYSGNDGFKFDIRFFGEFCAGFAALGASFLRGYITFLKKYHLRLIFDFIIYYLVIY